MGARPSESSGGLQGGGGGDKAGFPLTVPAAFLQWMRLQGCEFLVLNYQWEQPAEAYSKRSWSLPVSPQEAHLGKAWGPRWSPFQASHCGQDFQ